jgi:hypothetical protein
MTRRIFFHSMLPYPVANESKVEFQNAPPIHAPQASTIFSRVTSRIASKQLLPIHRGPLQFTGRSLSNPNFLIANLELEFLATETKRSSLTFSNRKKIAVFDPGPSAPVGEPKEISSPLTCLDDRSRPRRAIYQHISDRNSRFAEFRSTCCKHMPYQISNRNKNAYFALSASQIASHELRVAGHEPRTTTRAAFRSTIPRGQNADH